MRVSEKNISEGGIGRSSVQQQSSLSICAAIVCPRLDPLVVFLYLQECEEHVVFSRQIKDIDFPAVEVRLMG